MARPTLLLLSLNFLLLSCNSLELPKGEGQGLVAWDRTPPAGAPTWERPTWREGDMLVMKKGSANLYTYRVAKGKDQGWRLVEEKTGLATLLSGELAELGEEAPGRPEARVVLAPENRLLHWPLWVGKQWSCHYLHKRPGDPHPVPLVTLCRCDALEEVTVPAGTFKCLRIWSRTRVAAPGNYLERVSLLWYSPEAGYFVRRLESGVLLELQALHRQ